MQTSVVVLLAVLAVAAAQNFQPQIRAPVPILSHTLNRDSANQYSLSYATGDGAAHSDRAYFKPSQGPEGPIFVREGSHTYTSPEGRKITLEYLADETGYHPKGEHLPVAPALPFA